MMNRKVVQYGQMAGLASLLLLGGCSGLDVLDPKGPVGDQQKFLILESTIAMLIVVIPTILLTCWFAWKYRSGNTSAEYLKNWSHSNKLEVIVWGVPTIIIVFLAVITYQTCYSLDPYKPLEAKADVKPLHVEVVALDWKWLFIYPEQGIATVNQLAMPVNTPVDFLLTSDSVMNAFFVPRLGSMIYAMAGMQTQLHLMASEPGDYAGESANYSGRGFSDMKFRALAMPQDQFDAWVEKVRASSDTLDDASYARLAAPSEANPVAYYSTVVPNLFDQIVAKYNNGMVMDKSTGQMIHVQSAMADESMKE
ncbi:MAG: ubiquinol oxidase subunit II [Acetobacter sp.]|jgi:cytochrome o ubiquinol oxidase subunit 2|nr:ubiquinol oxidase subunit II [Acetobacter sp.]MCH4060419.1 ubiquinol oxidase subunit II [Acetobacter sp.]MCH4087359.1 ubiquinol oxidase subunit II [Acetobacter sp.]MCI1293878.1 ubiquinol oxidase subunit II [Acetobacter sp.]MCI1320528.1 ubiquinol oxidase subunit II [Acetobacter sp.]